MKSHQLIDARSLAFGRAIAAQLTEQPELVEAAKATLARWLQTCSTRTRPSLEEWRTTLDGPLEGIAILLTSPDDRSVRLRQSNPFAGLLPPAKRTAILKDFENHYAASA